MYSYIITARVSVTGKFDRLRGPIRLFRSGVLPLAPRNRRPNLALLSAGIGSDLSQTAVSGWADYHD